MPRPPVYDEQQLRDAIARSRCWSDVLRIFGRRTAGGNHRTVQRYAARWGIPTAHFDPHIGRRRAGRVRERPLEEVLVEHSGYERGTLKRRLFREGLKSRRCEICGLGEMWQSKPMSLILDHINGVADDNRIENLRIVCPNCAATLETHCGRNPVLQAPRACLVCDGEFRPAYAQHRYCSLNCVAVANGEKSRGVPKPWTRKTERPRYDQLVKEIEELGYSAVGRKYGVSDNAVRKWVRAYERAFDLAA